MKSKKLKTTFVLLTIFLIVLIAVISIVYLKRDAIINQIAINNYVEAFEEEDYIRSVLDVGKDIEPGLYTANYKYYDQINKYASLLNSDNASEETNSIGVTIYKKKLDTEFKVMMYPGNNYNNIKLEEGDTIEVFTSGGKSTWLPVLVEQDEVVEYSSEEKLAGFYKLDDGNIAMYDDNFGVSTNILYEYKDGKYQPRMFMPYYDIESDVSASDGDIIYLSSEKLINSVTSI